MSEHIERSQVLALIENRRSKYRKAGTRNQLLYDTLRYLERNVRNIPTEEVKPVIHARWNVILSSDDWKIRCSNCGRVFDRFVNGAILPEYCFCGATMDMKDS